MDGQSLSMTEQTGPCVNTLVTVKPEANYTESLKKAG